MGREGATRKIRRRLMVTAAVISASCASAAPGSEVDERGPDGSTRARVVLTGADVAGYGTMMDALRSEVRSLRVVDGRDCPSIALRNGRPPGPQSAPLVYVDGTRTLDPCWLQDLPPGSVSRVEVYPQGVTAGGGYAASANGLILVFLKRR